jgi:hypothetical protein
MEQVSNLCSGAAERVNHADLDLGSGGDWFRLPEQESRN